MRALFLLKLTEIRTERKHAVEISRDWFVSRLRSIFLKLRGLLFPAGTINASVLSMHPSCSCFLVSRVLSLTLALRTS